MRPLISLANYFSSGPDHLERVLREQIAEGQPYTHRPWKKILVIVEGNLQHGRGDYQTARDRLDMQEVQG